MKGLNELKNKVHQAAKEKGFWDEQHSDETMLMLIITEVSEAVEADRKGKRADRKEFLYFLADVSFERSFSTFIKDTVDDELADAFIRCLDLAGAIGLDLVDTIDDSNWEALISSRTFAENAYQVCQIISLGGNAVTKVIGAMAFLHDWCRYLGIDLGWHIEQKMKYNATRPQKHGKSY